MIYLAPEIRSGLGEDTFWTWMHREFPGASFDVPEKIGPRDVVLQYSTLGASRTRGGKTVALLWELHPELVRQGVPGDWSGPMARIDECARSSDFRVIASPIMREYYSQYGDIHELPIGVDGDLFAPQDKTEARRRRGLIGKQVAFWAGTPHPMKGADRMVDYAKRNPDAVVLAAWKKRPKFPLPKNCRAVVKAPQKELAQMMNCADFMLGTSRTRPYYMVEWEALCCGIPYRNVAAIEKDFEPSSDPRADVIARGWTRAQAKKTWAKFLVNVVGADL